MSNPSLPELIRRLCLAVEPGHGESNDRDLLLRFVQKRDEAAFEVLLWRHGTMVLNLCRRMLRHEQDAEDAFQATFLALAREAGSIGNKDSLCGWLYRVAFRIALKVRGKSARLEKFVPLTDSASHNMAPEVEWREIRQVLDEEVSRLPVKYRLPFILCCLEGRSNSEAAQEIGCPKGTVDSRLSWARQRLRERLVRRGVSLAAGGVAIDAVWQAEASAALPERLVRTTIQASVAFANGSAAFVSGSVLSLARGVAKAMMFDKIKRVFVAGFVLLALGGVGWGWHLAGAQESKDGAKSKKESAGAKSALPGIASKPGQPDQPPKTKTEPVPIQDDNIEVDREKEKANQFRALMKSGNVAIINSELRKKLQTPIDIDKEMDNVPFKDVLDFFSERYQVPIRFDYQAFARIGVKNPDKVSDQPVRVVKSSTVPFGVVLRDLLAGLMHPEFPGLDYGLLVKRGQLVIVPQVQFHNSPRSDLPPGVVDDSYNFDINNSVAQFSDPVQLTVEGKPLAEILKELADDTGANIVLDSRAKEKGKAPISLTLQDAPLDTVVRMLADMADLKSVALDNILYVTTADNAERIQKEQENAAKKRKLTPKVNNPGGGM
ncbi:MAG TPA: sigma-70 family RNA polymerase sigma factor [Gemmataceae bacterium]|nr:sigma-70 family RNA polymerase sigma factor [Gemmataceae bacterium]